ncbi:DUF2780 domain-containing protein [Kaustia mangrovi]|uniref:DUF2780 domain-containing protein n=1 Tax=Kaustia mangrovi TaxID=2593653 RepID=A0A7S8HBC0_9HYPH|nr:DUF2267 domain-containing protein [Kaustia mangrovi]QPC42028.1 DUF2780 domain-containing protein [Kaustia mangrovi]
MQDLIDRVATKLGIDGATAQKAVGIVLSLVRQNGDRAKVDELFAMLPGADDLARSHGDKPAGGLFGALAGAIGSGPMMALAKLQQAGLDTEQSKTLGKEVLAYARERGDERLVKDIAGSIPGLSDYV